MKVTLTQACAISSTVRSPHPTHWFGSGLRSEEHTSELQSQSNLVCRLLLEKKKRTLPIRSAEHTSELQSQSNRVWRLVIEKKNSLNVYCGCEKSIVLSLGDRRYEIVCGDT